MTHAELSKVLAFALQQAAAHLMTNTRCSYDELPDCITDALKQYDNTSQPARRNRREAQRARLCVDACAGMSDDAVRLLGEQFKRVTAYASGGSVKFSPSSAKRWPCPNTGD